MASIRVIPIIKFVRVDKTTLILVLRVRLKELACELTAKRLIVGRIAALLDAIRVVTATHSGRVVANRVVSYLVLIFDAHLFLVTATRQDVGSVLALLGHPGVGCGGQASAHLALMTNRVGRTLVELVVVLQQLHVLRVHRRALRLVKVRVRDRLVVLCCRVGILPILGAALAGIDGRHLSKMVLALLIEGFSIDGRRSRRLDIVDQVFVSGAASAVVVGQAIVVLVEGEAHRGVQELALEVGLLRAA
mmetsp:Transcript_26091/g.32591  ORF Transcript_26091/g.32591 Transcript_26091/m.32591 type:complete len:248 (-) Transcript_26091:826-1569(-)